MVRETERTQNELPNWFIGQELRIAEITRSPEIRRQDCNGMGKWRHSYADGKRNQHDIFGDSLAINVSKWKSNAGFDWKFVAVYKHKCLLQSYF